MIKSFCSNVFCSANNLLSFPWEGGGEGEVTCGVPLKEIVPLRKLPFLCSYSNCHFLRLKELLVILFETQEERESSLFVCLDLRTEMVSLWDHRKGYVMQL